MIVTAALVLLCGCAENGQENPAQPAEYEEYAEAVKAAETLSAAAVHVSCTYTLHFSDDSRQVFILADKGHHAVTDVGIDKLTIFCNCSSNVDLLITYSS